MEVDTLDGYLKAFLSFPRTQTYFHELDFEIDVIDLVKNVTVSISQKWKRESSAKNWLLILFGGCSGYMLYMYIFRNKDFYFPKCWKASRDAASSLSFRNGKIWNGGVCKRDLTAFRRYSFPRSLSLRHKSLAPCPNCERGICKVRKHGSLASKTFSSVLSYPSNSDFADDEYSDLDDSFQKKISGSYFSNVSRRLSPEGKDISSHVYRRHLSRENSLDSISSSYQGSNYNIVQSFKEVRQLIRNTSFDSLSSDFSFNELADLSLETNDDFPSISSDFDEEIERQRVTKKDLWRLTAIDYESRSSVSPWKDEKTHKIKMVLNELKVGNEEEWHWDSEECILQERNEDYLLYKSHDIWLNGEEPELEMELSDSRRNSLEFLNSRLPPSGRSSVELSHEIYCDKNQKNRFL